MNEHFTRRGNSPSNGRKSEPGSRRRDRFSAMLMELEQRIAFDAAGAATIDHAQKQTDHGGEKAPVDKDTTRDAADNHELSKALSAAPHDAPQPTQPQAEQLRQVVVIDSSVPDYQSLLSGMDKSVKVIVLEQGKDGVEELAKALSEMHDVQAIHIISHGDEGRLYLGSAELTIESMSERYADQLESLRGSLSDDADILIYGCDFAKGATGENAARMMGYLTGADIAASNDGTGSAEQGGDWDLEFHDGDITTRVAPSLEAQRDYAELLTVQTAVGNGSLLISSGKVIYSVDVATGKATAITTVPTSVGGVTISDTINSLAVDQANGLIYYTDSNADNANRALFAYDFVRNTHILIDSDLTDNGTAASITVGERGVGSGAATFYNGSLYLGVENVNAAGDDRIFRITFTNNGRTVATAATFGALVTNNDWGDFGIDATNNNLLSINQTNITRYSLATGTVVGTALTNPNSALVQGGGDLNGNTYIVGSSLQQINPTTGAVIGSAIAITTNGSTAIGTVSDGARWVPPTGSIGDKIYDDNNLNGAFDTGDAGVSNVTVQLIDDVNGNGIADTGERVLATDTTDASGNYLFTGVLPGQYVVRVTDTNGVLGSAPSTSGGVTQSVALSTIGAAYLAADFGYNAQAPIIDLNSGTTPTQIVTNGGAPGTTGWAVGGAGGGIANDGFAWTVNGGTGTLTQANISGWNDGLAPSGSAQLTFDLGWSNNTVLGISNDNNTPATLDITIGGVLYARVTTGTLNGTPNTATITYFNGASGSPATVTASTAGTTAWTRTPITLNLPSTVAPTGDLVFTYSAAGGLLTPSTDDIFIDNVSALTRVDSVPGVNYTTTYTENGAGVSIGSALSDVRDLDSTNMRSATIVLTNAQAGDLLTLGTLPTGISGSIDTSVSGQITVTLTGSATKANYAAAIRAITFSNSGDNPGTTARVINVTVNDGGLSSPVATATISVVAVNDAPVNSLPAGWTTNEDTSVGLSGLSIADPDAGTGTMSVTLNVSGGAITAISGGSVSVAGSGTATVTLTGTLANINAYLASAAAPVYVPAADANGAFTLTMTTNDGGNSGTGGALTDIDTRTITVNAVNDAPLLDLDGTAAGSGYSTAYTENAAGVAIAAANNTVVDVDNTTMASATVVITNGQAGDILAANGALPAGITASYNATTYTLTLSGAATKAAYQTALAQILYSSTSDNPTVGGTVTGRSISVTVNDGALASNTAVTTVAVTAVNDAPVNTLPAAGWTTNEDNAVALTGLSIADLDAASGTMTVALSVGSGTLTATAGSGVTVSGSGTATLTLTGTLASINGYLASAAAPVYTPVADANGSVTLTMTTSDGGNTGTGGVLVDIDTRPINITPVNDAPALDLDASAAGTGYTANYTENAAGVAIANANALISDVDNANMASLTVTIANGQAGDVLAAGSLPPGITASYNAATFTLTLTGSATKADYQTALQQLRYSSTSENPSTISRTINVTVNDGALNSNTATTTVNVIAVNDAPVNTVPGPVTVSEDVSSLISGISVDDVDSGSVTVTLRVNNGILTPGTGGATISGSGTATVTISGTLVQVNASLAALRYQGNADFNGSDTLTITTSDGALSDTDTVAITVTPVADIVADTVTTAEDTPLSFNVLTGTNGASADNFESAGRFVSAITQPPAGQGTVTFNADGTMTYTPAANFNGTTSFTYTVTSGGVTETATVTVNVTGVNDAPVNTLPASGWATSEDTSIALTGLSVADVDAGSGPMTVSLSVTAGSLTALSGGNVTVTGSGTATITLSGTLADINAYLASAAVPSYAPVANANGAATLTMTTNDGGNTGAGGPLTDVDTRPITISAVNDAPVNTLPATFTTAEDTALGLAGLAISDVDAGNGTMTVTLAVNSGALTAVSGSDVTVTGSGGGTLVLSGSLASINAYLASAARPSFAPAADFNGAVTLTMTTNDGGNTGSGGALSDVDTSTITVTPVNDAPTLDLDASGAGTGFVTSYTENGSGVAIVDTDVLIADIDNANMASATVVIANGRAGDALSISGTLPGGIIATYDAATFTLTLSGSASKADYQAALQQIRYASSSDDPGTTARTINVTVSDGAANSNVTTATVSVIAVNDPPVNTLPGSYSTGEDTPLSLSGLSISDPDAGTGTMTVTLSVNSGTLAAASGAGVTVSGSGSGTVTLSGTLAALNAYLAASGTQPVFTGIADFNGSVTLTMVSSDGALTDTDVRTITVTPVADIANDTATTNEDTSVAIDVNANDSFENPGHVISAINGTSVVANGVVSVANGSVGLNADGTLNFTPSADFNGTASFTYTVTSGGVSETATVTVNVTPVNDAPVNTVPGAQTVAEDTALAIGGVSVSDVDGGTLTTTLSVTHGTVTVAAAGGATIGNNGSATVTIAGTAAQINAALAGLTYLPDADYNGAAQLSVVTSDGGLSDSDTVAISVTPVADITNDTVTTAEDTALSFNVITGTNGATPDNFESAGRAVTSVTQPPAGQGTVTFSANGTLVYTPAANFNGTTSFTYTVTSGGVTETATVTVNVTAVNDAPVSTIPGAQTIAEDGTIVFSPAGGNAISVSDIDSGTLTVTLNVTNGAFSLSRTTGLTFSAGDGTSDQTMTFSGSAAAINAALAGATYAPTADYNGPAQISITTSDGALSDGGTIPVTITPVADIANDSVSTDEDTAVTIAVLANDSFENPGRAITAINGTAISTGSSVAVANGTVQLIAGGQLVFTPTLDYNGVTTFSYTVTSGGVTETATVSVAVASVNTPPVNTIPTGFATLEDTALGLAGLSVADADAGTGTISVTLSVNSGSLAASSAAGVNVTGSGSGELVLSGSISAINAYLSGATRPSFTPAANSTASVTLTMTTNDNGNTGGPALSDIDTSTITITSVNDAPAGTDKTVTINEDAAYTFSAADFGFTDPNDTPANSFASVIISTLPTNGTLTLGGVPVTAGQVISAANISGLSFTPAANANGAALASFTFQVRDNGGTANGGVDTDPTPNRITFNVTAVNDAPVNTLPANFATNEDTALSLSGLSIGDVDAGTGAVTVTLSVGSGTLTATSGANVTIAGSGSGTIRLSGTVADINAYLASNARPVYTPVANANGSVTLTMVTNDNGNTGTGGPLSDTDISTIAIAAVNDAPVGSDTAFSTNEDTVFSGTLPVATDADGDTLSYSAGSTGPAHGVVVINANGTYSYAPSANYNGPDSFTYRVTDGTAVVEYTVTVTVNAVNDAPSAMNDTAQTAANSNVSVNVIANDTDIDGDTLSVSQVNGIAGNVGAAVAGSNGGTFTIGANGAAVFNPGNVFADLAAGQTRTSSVSYQVSDGNGGVSTATFTVTVTGINDAPVSTPIANQSSSDAEAVSLDVSGNFSDPDSGDTLTFTATGLPAGLSISAAGVITGTINRSASVNGPYSVTVTATDRAGAVASRSFTWAVANPAPIARDDTLATTENAAISGSVFADNGAGIDRDPDGDPISVSAVGGSQAGVGTAVAGSNGGSFTINADGTYTFNPGTSFDNLAAGQTRTTSVTYTISDGQGGLAMATVTVTVTGQNDAPIAGADSFVTNEDTAVTIAPLANDSDVDGGTLSIAEINGTAVTAGSTVTVTGGMVTLNANQTLTFNPAPDYNGNPVFTYRVSDGQGGSTVATISGTVNAVEDAPVATADTFTTPEDTAVTFDVRSNDTDADGDPLTVTQINGTAIAAGRSVAIAGGTVTLNANGTLTFTPTADYNGNPTFIYTVSDGKGGTSSATVSGTVTPVQDPPVAVNDSFSTPEDTPFTIAVLGNDSDPDGDPLTVTAINGAAIAAGQTRTVSGGTVTLNVDGTLTFNPAANYNGAAGFSYTVSDGQGGTATAVVSGSVTAVNDAPVAGNDSFTTAEDTPATFDLRANDTDVDGDPLTVTAINGSAVVAGTTVSITGGSVTLNADGTVTFNPAANYNGNPVFTYTVSDGKGGTATGTVTGTVTPVNDAPVAGNDSFTTPEDAPVTFDVRANDSDADGDALAVTAINGTAIASGQSVAIAGGSVTLDADGRLTFTPNANFNGAISFSYTVSDGTATATGTVSGTVSAVNDAPVSGDTTISTPEDTTFTGQLTATDVDGDTVTFQAGSTRPANGTVTINADGSYSYVPNANFNGTDTFSFSVRDPSGASNEYTVTVSVSDVNDPPVGTPLPDRSANDGASVNFDVSGFFNDADGDRLQYSQTGLPAGLGINENGLITGTIDRQASQGGPDGNGVYQVTITAADGRGGTVSQTFALAVSNPAPVAVNDTATTAEDTPVTIDVLANDSDPDGDPLTVTAASAAHGAVTIGANGAITYQPAGNFNGTDTITYTISDGNGGTATGTVQVTVTAENDDPVGNPIADRTRNDGDTDSLDVSAFFTDPDGDPLSYSVTGLPPGLTLSGTTISGRILPDASGPTGEKVYTVNVTASDGAGGAKTVTFTYTVINVPPVANDDAVTTVEDRPVDIFVLANDSDPDGDDAEVIRVNNVVLQPNGTPVATTNGSVQLIETADGTRFLRFTPVANYNGQESFTYSIDDGNGGIDTATVTVTVTPENDTPVPTNPIPDRVRADGQSFAYDVSDFFADPDGDALSYTVTGLPAGLSVDGATGQIFGNIDRNASQGGPDRNGVYSVTVTASDGNGGSVVQTFTLTVTNPGPVANNDTVSMSEDGTATFNPITGAGTASGTAGADIDPDGDPLTITAASAGHGTVSINGDGTLTYAPELNFNGIDTIVYTISDGNGGVSTATVRVTVAPVNDAPTADPIPDQYDSDSQTIDYDVSPYFSDVDGDSLAFTATGLPPGLSIGTDGRISGVLAANASVNDPYVVTITANDGNGGSVTQTVTWIVTNLPPKAFNDTLTVDENTAGTGNALTNDRDPDGDPLTIDQVEGQAANVGNAVAGSNGGTFTINANGTYTFNPGNDFNDMAAGDPPRTTTITYRVTDNNGGVDAATITVTVTGVNDRPTADPIPGYTRADGQSLTDQPLHLAAFFQDVDKTDSLTFAADGLPQGLTMGPDGTITGIIARNASQGGANGVYVVSVTATDQGGLTVTQTFSLRVTNPAPTAVNDAVSTAEDTAIDSIDVLANDTDPDGDTLFIDPTFTPVAGNGTVTVNPDGTLRYVPNANFNGTDTIVYRVTDGQGGVSTGIVTVSIDAENDPPISSPISDIERNDGDSVSFDISGHFTDPEGEALSFSASNLPPGLQIDPATGVISGTIDPEASGPTGIRTYTVNVTATDPEGASRTEVFTYTIRNVAPSAENDAVTTLEDRPVDIDILANDTDPDGDTDTVILVNGVNLTVGGASVATANGSVQLVLNGAGREVLRFTPNPNFNGTESFAYTIGDRNGGSDTATVTVTVTPVNDAPVGTTIPDRTQTDSSAVDLDLRPYFTDVDGQALTISVDGLPLGLAFDPATGHITGNLAASASQGSPYTVIVTASDGALTASESFVFTVTNPAPNAVNDTVTTSEDQTVVFNPITGSGTTSGAGGADSDPDGDPLTITQIDGQAIAAGGQIAVAGGTVTLGAGGQITFVPTPDFNGTTGFTYRLSDGNGGFSDASVTINVTAVNDVPVIDLNGAAAGSGTSANFTEGGGPVPIVAPDGFISDVEGGIVAIDLDLSGFQDPGNEVIHLNGAKDIVYGTASSGTIAFGGTTFFFTYDGAGHIHFENAAGAASAIPDGAGTALLRSLQYENQGDNPTEGSRSITVSVTDGGNASSSAVAAINVGAVNDPPIAGDDTATTGENTPIVNGTSILGNDSDPEGNPLSIIAVGSGTAGAPIAGSAGGSFIVAADGTYRFDPGTAFDDLQAGESRDTSVTYTISDGNGGTATARLTITVTGQNDAPEGGNISLVVNEDTPATGQLPVTDADGDPLTFAVAGQPANGTVLISADGRYTYLPAANFNGPDSFTYTVSDGTTTVTFTVSLTVSDIEDPPSGEIPNQAFDDAGTVNLDISGFFTDPDGDDLTFTQTGLPAGLTMNDAGLITGRIASDASQANPGGVYVVTVTVDDGAGGVINRDFTITVSNPPPVAQNDAFATGENTPLAGSVFGNNGSGADADPDGDAIGVVAVNGQAGAIGTAILGSAGGSFTIGADGRYVFDPGTAFDNLRAGETRNTSVTYTISDGQGGTSTATVTVTVTGTNDAPIGADQTVSATEDTPYSGRLPIATDAEGDSLTYGAGNQPANGSVVVNADGTYEYRPNPDFNGTDIFTYTVSDGSATRTYTVTVNVGAVNDAPVLQDVTISTTEDTAATGRLVATDADDGPADLVYAVDTNPAHGTLTVNPDGTYSYTPAANFNGQDSFRVVVTDPDGATSIATVTVNIGAVNDQPVAVDDNAATTENAGVSGNVIIGSDSDPDGDTLTVVTVGAGPDGVGRTISGSAGGSFVILADGSYRFEPGTDFDDLQTGESRTTTVAYTISDGNGGTASAILTVTVNGTNDLPQAPAIPPRTDADGSAVTYPAGDLFTDADGDTLSFSATGLPPGLSLNTATGAISGTIAASASGPTGAHAYSVAITADDGHGGTVTRNFVWTVTNPAPDAQNDSFSMQEGGVLTGSVLADNGNGADTDPDGDPLTVSLVNGPANGTLTLNANGTFTYRPNAFFNGSDSFSYRIADGNGGFDTATVTIGIGAVNDAPVAGNDSFAIDEDGSAVIAVLGNDSDPDGDVLSVVTVDGQAIAVGSSVAVDGGRVTLDATGTLTFTAAADFNGAVSFTYGVSDGVLTTEANVTGTVRAINDAPVNTLPGSFAATEDTDLRLQGLSVTDVDAGTGRITVTLGVDAGSLLAASGGAVTVSGSGSAQLTLSGTLSAINAYLAGGSAPVFRPLADSNAAVTLTMTTNDNGNSGANGPLSATSQAMIMIEPVNDAPVAGNQQVATSEDTPVAGQISASDTDGDALSYSIATGPANGTVSIDNGGRYLYSPAMNFNGTDRFTVLVSDGNGGTTSAVVTISVAPVNDAPVGSDTSATATEDTPLNGRLPVATDPEGSPLTYGLGSQAANGTVIVNPDGTYRYVPNTNFNGTDSFTYTVSDGTATSTYTVTIAVAAVNDAPVSSNTAISVTEDTPFSGRLPAASDAEGQPVSYALGAQATNGTVTINPDGSYTYIPAADFNGTDSFTFTVSDGRDSNTYRVSVTVGAANDAPIGSDTSIRLDEDGTFNGRLPVATDPEGSLVSYGLGAQAANGTAVIRADGTFSYSPNPNFNGTDRFTYTVSDGTATSTYTVTVTVNAVNDAPVGSNTSIAVTEDTRFDGQLPTAIDPEGQAVVYGLGTQATKGTVTVNPNGSFSYVPGADADGSDSFTYTVSDGTATSTYTVTVTIGAVNDPPVGSDASIAVNEDSVATGRLPTARDPEGLPVSYGLGAQALHGTVAIQADGTYRYVPNANFNGTDSFTFTVSDGVTTSTYTATVTVNAVNDAPVSSSTSISVPEDGQATGNLPPAFDADGDPVAYNVGAPPRNGSVTIAADGRYTYVPNPNFNGSDSFTFTVNDGRAVNTYTVTVTVDPINDPPVGADGAIAVTEDTAFNGRLPVASDPDGDRLTYGLGRTPAHGTLSLNPDGTYRFVPDRNFNGSDSFTYVVSDGTATSTYTITITVGAVNDAPVGSDTSISTNEGLSTSGRLPQAIDPEGDPISYGLGQQAAHGRVTINADGTYTYIPAAGYSGRDSFTYTVTDGDASATYTVTVTIEGAGEPPEEPRPPLEIDPPETPSATPSDPGRPEVSGSSPGEPLTIGSITDDLNGIAGDITDNGPINNVVNAINPLNGIGSLPDHGAVLYSVRQISDWIESGRTIDKLTAGFFKGGSNIHQERSGGIETFFQIDTMVYKDYLYIMPSSSGGVENATFGVTLGDGKPLPGWLRMTRQGLLIGHPPAGLPYIDLKVYGISGDGSVSDTIRIDLHTGTVLDHVADKRAENSPVMFSDRINSEFAWSDSNNALLSALDQWSMPLDSSGDARQ